MEQLQTRLDDYIIRRFSDKKYEIKSDGFKNE
jgi:hypothetical protein